MLLFPFLFEEGFDDGFLFSVGDLFVMLFQLTSLLRQSVCLFVAVDPTMCWNPLQGQIDLR